MEFLRLSLLIDFLNLESLECVDPASSLDVRSDKELVDSEVVLPRSALALFGRL